MNSSFFKQVFAAYNLIWQQVLKLTLVNNSLVDKQSFVKVLHRAGLNIHDPFCQLLLCASQQQQNQLDQEALIDYKIFLNVALKSLSKEQMSFSEFLIELFWDSRIGGGSHQGVKIDAFNSAFYEFFHRDSKLLSAEQAEHVLNQCFTFLLNRNKKLVSKRSLKKVIHRYFKEVFFQIENALFKNQRNEQNSCTLDLDFHQEGYSITIPEDETLGGNKFITNNFPDSLEQKSQKISAFSNPSKSFNETSTFHNISNQTKYKSLTNLNDNFCLNGEHSLKRFAYQGNLTTRTMVKIQATEILAQYLECMEERLCYDQGFKALKYFFPQQYQTERGKENPNYEVPCHRQSQIERLSFSFQRKEQQFDQQQYDYGFNDPKPFTDAQYRLNRISLKAKKSLESLQYSATPSQYQPTHLNEDTIDQQPNYPLSTKSLSMGQTSSLGAHTRPRCDTTRYHSGSYQPWNQKEILHPQELWMPNSSQRHQNLIYQSDLNSHCQSTKRSNTNPRLRENPQINDHTHIMQHRFPASLQNLKHPTLIKSGQIFQFNTQPNLNEVKQSFNVDQSSIEQNSYDLIDNSTYQKSQDPLIYSKNQKKRSSYDLTQIEKKYRRSKEKLKTMVQEINEQKQINITLQSCNQMLQEKVGILEQQVEQVVLNSEQMQSLIDSQNNQQQILRVSMATKSIIQIYTSKQEKQQLKALHQWQQHIQDSKMINKIEVSFSIHQSKALLAKPFNAWQRYALTRQTRKEKHSLFKIKCKVIASLFRKKIMRQKKAGFNKWKHPFMHTMLVQEAQKDIQTAHEQVRLMRIIMSLSKLSAFVERKHYTFQSQGYTGIIRHSMNNENKENLNNKSNKNSQVFLRKGEKIRNQNKFFDGCEKIYKITKKINQKIKAKYLEHWKYMDLWNQEINQRISIINSGQKQEIQGEFEMLNNGYYQQLYCHHDQDNNAYLSNPGYYKTNEGFYHSAHFQPMSPNLSKNKQRLNENPSHFSSATNLQFDQGNNQSSIQSLAPISVAPKPYPQQVPYMNSNQMSRMSKSPHKTSNRKKRNQNDISQISEVNRTSEDVYEAIAYLKTKINL